MFVCSLDDEIWEIRFNFPGEDNLERFLSRSDITVMNIMGLIEGYGYGILDRNYFTKQIGKGMKGMELVDRMAKVEQMLDLFEQDKILKLTVIRQNAAPPSDLNKPRTERQAHLDEPIVLSVDKEGVTSISISDEEIVPVAVDYTDVPYVSTQQSCNLKKGKTIITVDNSEGGEEEADSDDDFYYDRGEYRHELYNTKLDEELEEVEKIKMLIRQQREERKNIMSHYEGDTDVEEIYEESEEEEEEEVSEAEEEMSEAEEVSNGEQVAQQAKKKAVRRPGPTIRAHHEKDFPEESYYVPFSDEEKILVIYMTVMMTCMWKSLHFQVGERGF